MATLPSYTDSFTKAEREAAIPNASDKLLQSKNGVYFYNQNNNSLDIPLLNGTPASLIEVRGEDLKEPFSFDYFDKNKWVLGAKNEHDEPVILTPSKKVNCYEAAMKTTLFDDNYLLVNDNLSLYLLDLRNNESSLIKSGISDFFV